MILPSILVKQKPDERKSSRDDRKNAQIEDIFKKLENGPKGGRRRTQVTKESRVSKFFDFFRIMIKIY